MKNLKKLRTEQHLSQSKLASIFHISQQSVWKYENDLSQPDFNLLIAFADYFNVSVDYLLDRTDNPASHRETPVQTLSPAELEHLRLYRASPVSVKELTDQLMRLYLDLK